MPVISFRPDETTSQLGPRTPVPSPIGPVPHFQSKAFANPGAATRTGVWQCEPGRLNRSSLVGEWCYITEGEGSFEAADGERHALRPGTALYIPGGTNGIWQIDSRLTKVFVTFEE